MENQTLLTEYNYKDQREEFREESSSGAGQILWVADYFQITPEGQEFLQKVANTLTL
ncbi:hypothetical protein [Oceanispirochaeta sp.]|jgi:hypothetical protein|uniref:hypothetical protein n=1 Tax=Oceanispirochaeta sp. TaxID=2035350 RepID=UPI00260B46DB|nr:hypothetical protein [Oceanispirochaeta sp.]MDA3958609.1 hypothetical protein [Oceanispirochaeta sp.]